MNMDLSVYKVESDAIWGYNGRNGRGLDRGAITEKMQRTAVGEAILLFVRQYWGPNRRATHLTAAKLYEWYRTHACPFPGAYVRYLDFRIVHRSSRMVVVSIDVSSGGVVELCRFKS